MSQCSFCTEKAQYQDPETGQYVCLQHTRLRVVAAGQRSTATLLNIRPATASDRGHIEQLSLYFWDETEVDCFDRPYDVTRCPAFLACDGAEVVGLAVYASERDLDAAVLVILSVLPSYQGRGAGRALLDAVCGEAAQCGLARVLVATSNDDLPALALYQRCGFHLTGVIPGIIAQHHGAELPGFAGIPIRDEIRFAYPLT